MNDSLCDLCSLALSTRLIIFDTVLSPKLFVVCTRSTPVRFTQPDTTSSPLATRHRLASERNGVERRLAFDDTSVQRHLFAWLYQYRLANLHIRRRHNDEFAAALYGSGIGTYIHKMGYAVATFALGIAFKQFAYLEEQHHEDCFGKLGLCTWQETDT